MSSFRRRQMLAAGGGAKDYILFADPVVAQICATNWGDGVGITPAQAAAVTDQQFGTTFKGNTQITSFDELQYFTGLTYLAEEAFSGCTSLESVKIPASVTTLQFGVFLNCSGLIGTFEIPDTVTAFRWDMGYATLEGTLGLTNIVNNMTSTLEVFRESGNGTGIYYTKTTHIRNSRYINARYRHILVDGDLTFSIIDWAFNAVETETIRINGDYIATNDGEVYWSNSRPLKFVELMGVIISNGALTSNGYEAANSPILHLGYNGIAGTPSQLYAPALSKIYVGSGESQAADQAVLNQYLTDPDWAQYASKLDLWYNYNGEYKNWPTIPTA